MKNKLLILFLSIASIAVFGQGEIDLQDKIFYRNERTFGFLLNSNGLGLNYRYAKRIDGFKKTLYELEFNYLKHPKEIKATLTSTNKNIIFGKLNSTFTLKGGLGFQKELFQKADIGSVSIRYYTNFGPVLAIQKPIYYEYLDINSSSTYYKNYDPYDPYLYGKAPYSKGLNKTSVIPGIYGKFGFTFEYSKLDVLFHAIELGVAMDIYAGKLEIMDASTEKILFILPDDHFTLTLFISYRFGQVINSQFTSRRNKIDNLISD